MCGFVCVHAGVCVCVLFWVWSYRQLAFAHPDVSSAQKNRTQPNILCRAYYNVAHGLKRHIAKIQRWKKNTWRRAVGREKEREVPFEKSGVSPRDKLFTRCCCTTSNRHKSVSAHQMLYAIMKHGVWFNTSFFATVDLFPHQRDAFIQLFLLHKTSELYLYLCSFGAQFLSS